MLEIVNISKQFEKQTQSKKDLPAKALDEVSLTIREGEFFSLLGPSGCGKSTLLRILAGLESATGGDIRFRQELIHSWPAQKRPFNMVFQKYALFPHLTVAGNIAFGLKIKKTPAHEIQQKIQKVLRQVGLEGFENRWPETLSGGQAQRVAVARALVNEPKILLLDEPLSALDEKLRVHMQKELRSLHRELGLTFIYVTHDQEEALTMSDRVGVMNRGRIEQVSSPRDLYERPETFFAADFIGSMNHLRGQVHEIHGAEATVRIGEFFIRGRGPKQALRVGDLAVVCIRPEKINLVGEGENILRGRIRGSIFRGSQVETSIETPVGNVSLLASQAVEGAPGRAVELSFRAEEVFIFEDAP